MKKVSATIKLHAVKTNDEVQMGHRFFSEFLDPLRIHFLVVQRLPRAEKGAWRATDNPCWFKVGNH